MTGIARVGDMVEAWCDDPSHGSPKKTTGFFDIGDNSKLVDRQPIIKLGDIVHCDCGHDTIVTTASVNEFSSTVPVARIGDLVSVPIGPKGKIITGSASYFNYDVTPVARIVPTEITNVIPPEAIPADATFYDAVSYTVVEDKGDPDSFVEPAFRPPEEDIAIAYVGVVEDDSPAIPNDEDNMSTIEPPPPNGGNIILNCDNIPDDPSPTLRISDSYNLASLSTHTACSSYPIISQLGRTKKQIVCNLSKLATQLLEPIGREFGKPLVTSGFRHGTGKSNHNKGCAADIQWPELNGSEVDYYNRIVWIRDNLIWNELILEYGGQTGPWLHVSFQEGYNNRTNFKTLKSLAGNGIYEMGVFKLYKNVPNVGGRSF